MNNFLYKHRFFLSRRLVQIAILTAYFGANAYGWSIVSGDLSSSIVFGFIPLSDPFASLQMFFAGAVVSVDILFGVLVVLFFYGIIGGRFFCSWVCPVNIVTESASDLRKKLNLQEKESEISFSRNIRYWIIVISLLLSFIFSLAAFEMISPIGIAHRGIIFGFGFGWTFLVTIFLFDLFSQKYGWCGHICPLGGFNALIGKYSLIKVVHDKDKCLLSMECFKACPEVDILEMVGKESHIITGATCIKCGRCIEVCDNDAFKVSVVGLAKQLKGKL
ncbi:MAG: quinol dehydrogenase ferredoxin subunit NapH [Sulfurimonas sp. RIFOXYD12_FULL_33_39]|uniref:quinol dehydrogenase ferredoxin subunit NapH n=1 Tax=unclassified Sulfurimonas TaxID=2623549 RepID=UPI0008C9008F|nr:MULTISPECIES: quinol dehydrogenase ferredoxin subunit NapH [unclassified Sulfurimonas]OHE09000.1 MAG: quinol dehydrogenase ferredoxin subunit NapH [Sulfurimonas sp. RIFOXYD12_FULL_33_39]OHE14310.1 MAG: quinol dehydrogenase ferredoxin subunit NapH [Sulfurimonas sp. RIFOXYD2_FULL_34_21]DAB28379.1 MAG TPA: quinol dehydrogenase ferredoxin subunit NapH [Sulfurimonas sp. UBA10385]